MQTSLQTRGRMRRTKGHIQGAWGRWTHDTRRRVRGTGNRWLGSAQIRLGRARAAMRR